MEQRGGLTSAKRELARIEARQKKLLDMMLDDAVPVQKGKAEMKALEERRLELDAQLKTAEELRRSCTRASPISTGARWRTSRRHSSARTRA
jgi:hypothetical protein